MQHMQSCKFLTSHFMVNRIIQFIFWTFTNPIWLLMINLPKQVNK